MNSSDRSAPKRDKTLRKGLRIIELLTTNGPQNLRSIATLSNLSRPNAHQILRTLVEEGYALQDDDTGQYSSSLKLWEIGACNVERMSILAPCKPVMEQLRDQYDETINLAVLDGGEVLYLHKEDPGRGIGSFTRIGGRAPAHCVATGKALLAFHPDGEVAWRKLTLVPHSGATIVDPDAFVQEMEATRARGYSTLSGEWRGDVVACAAPIFGWNNTLRAAIGISGPKDRMPPERIAELGPILRKVTQGLSARSSIELGDVST